MPATLVESDVLIEVLSVVDVDVLALDEFVLALVALELDPVLLLPLPS